MNFWNVALNNIADVENKKEFSHYMGCIENGLLLQCNAYTFAQTFTEFSRLTICSDPEDDPEE